MTTNQTTIRIPKAIPPQAVSGLTATRPEAAPARPLRHVATYRKPATAATAARLNADDLIRRYCAAYSRERLQFHFMRVLVLSHLCFDLADTLCDCLTIGRDPRTKGMCRDLRTLPEDFRGALRGGRMEYLSDLDSCRAMAESLSERLDGAVSRFCRRFRAESLPALVSEAGQSGKRLICDADSLEAYLLLQAA